MSTTFTADIALALDQFDVPPPSAGFFDRLTAIAQTEPAVLPPHRPRFRTTMRGRWMTRGAVVVLAFGVASATAAATGVFHAIGFDIPAIAQFVAPAPVKRAATPKHRHHPAKPIAAPPPAVAVAKAAPTPPMMLTREERRARFRALPMPVRAVMIERRVTRIQRRLAWQGIDAPRAAIRARVEERLGQSDLPTGSDRERRAQLRAAVLAAAPGTLPPRLERWRWRIMARQARAERIWTPPVPEAVSDTPTGNASQPAVEQAPIDPPPAPQ